MTAHKFEAVVRNRLIAVIAVAGLAGMLINTGYSQASGQTGGSDPPSVRSLLQEPLQAGQAYVRYLVHCGYAVKTRSKLLIFDYVRTNAPSVEPPAAPSLANGWINPDEVKALDVYVFVTHAHEDHYDSVILDWSNQLDRLTYIFGWRATDDTSHYHLVDTRDSLELGDLRIYTINSENPYLPEVAYLVQVDGLNIFYQGDYKGNQVPDMEYLLSRCDTVDMAFVGAHTRKWRDASSRVTGMLEKLRPRVVFPMHYGGAEDTYRTFAQECAALNPPFVVEVPQSRGHRFHYSRRPDRVKPWPRVR